MHFPQWLSGLGRQPGGDFHHLRALFIRRRRQVDVYLDDFTSKALRARFGYCFEAPPGSEYPPIVTEHRLAPGRCVTVDGEGGPITALPVLQPSSCCFRGPDMRRLFITSAAVGLTGKANANGFAGAVFAVDLEVRGLPTARYHG